MDIFVSEPSELTYRDILDLQIGKLNDLLTSLSDREDSFIVEHLEDDCQIYFEHIRQSYADLRAEFATIQVRMKDGDVILIHLDPTQESDGDLVADLWQRAPWLISSMAYFYKKTVKIIHKGYIEC